MDDIVPDPVVDAIDMHGATPDLFAALHQAQQQAQTVGKDGHNNHSRYNYATAEAMIRAGRACRNGTGLSLVCTTTVAHAPPPAPSAKQWVCATVTVTWVLTCAKGGWMRGRSECDAIASGLRPNDKAIQAAATYMHGFIERDLFDLDRAEESDAVDQREDKDYRPPQEAQRKPAPKQSKPAPKPEAKASPTATRGIENSECRKLWASYVVEASKHGRKPTELAEFLADVLGKPVAEVAANEAKWNAMGDKHWAAAARLIMQAKTDLAVPAEREPGDDDAGADEYFEDQEAGAA
jgi:hypothetical protein